MILGRPLRGICAVLAHGLGAFGQSSPVSTPDPPAAETIRRCASERDRGQTSKVDGRWLEAREAFRQCAQDECPIAMRSECRSWQDELSAQIPSVVFVVEAPSADASSARVLVEGFEGQSFPPEVPIELEPGEHHFRVELPSHSPRQLSLRLAPGERHRLVRVRFAPPPTAAATGRAQQSRFAAPAVGEPGQPGTVDPTLVERPIPPLSYGLGLGAIVGIAAATGLYVSARSDLDEARATCAPNCSSSVRESVELKLFLADTAGAASVLLGAAASYLYLTRPESPRPSRTSALQVSAGHDGAVLWVQRNF